MNTLLAILVGIVPYGVQTFSFGRLFPPSRSGGRRSVHHPISKVASGGGGGKTPADTYKLPERKVSSIKNFL